MKSLNLSNFAYFGYGSLLWLCIQLHLDWSGIRREGAMVETTFPRNIPIFENVLNDILSVLVLFFCFCFPIRKNRRQQYHKPECDKCKLDQRYTCPKMLKKSLKKMLNFLGNYSKEVIQLCCAEWVNKKARKRAENLWGAKKPNEMKF